MLEAVALLRLMLLLPAVTDGIPVALLVDNIGVIGVVLLIGWWMGTGRWVPRKTHEDKIHEANEWRTECRIKDQALLVKDEQIAVKDRQLEHLVEVGRTVDAIMSAIQSDARGQS